MALSAQLGLHIPERPAIPNQHEVGVRVDLADMGPRLDEDGEVLLSGQATDEDHDPFPWQVQARPGRLTG